MLLVSVFNYSHLKKSIKTGAHSKNELQDTLRQNLVKNYESKKYKIKGIVFFYIRDTLYLLNKIVKFKLDNLIF